MVQCWTWGGISISLYVRFYCRESKTRNNKLSFLPITSVKSAATLQKLSKSLWSLRVKLHQSSTQKLAFKMKNHNWKWERSGIKKTGLKTILLLEWKFWSDFVGRKCDDSVHSLSTFQAQKWHYHQVEKRLQ